MSNRMSGSPAQVSITFSEDSAASIATDALLLAIPGDQEDWTGSLAEVDEAMGGQLQIALQAEGFKGAIGSTSVIPTLGIIPARRIIALGLPEYTSDTEEIRKAYAAAATAARNAKVSSIAVVQPECDLDETTSFRAITEGTLLALYEFKDYLSGEIERMPVESMVLLATETDAASTGVRQGVAVSAGVYLARDMVFEPPNSIYPVTLAAVAREMATNQELEYQEFDEVQLKEMGAGAIVAVGQGSVNPPRLVRMTYTPVEESLATIALVGKGITFDTGGMSLKTGEGMVTMKTDMGGSAAVLGTMRAISELDLPFTVHGIIAAAENMPSDTAYRPSDVLTALNSKTIEVISTDAEGRLVLADALVYAAQLGSEEMIDLATLTGAKVVALGERSVAVFSNDDELADNIIAAGNQTGELFWRMPLWDEMRRQLSSETADMKNTGGRAGGAITAALFLSEFAEGRKWAHLDIAGAAWASSTSGYTPKGASGVGVRALVQYLENKQTAL